jgi:hypothetical protein
MVKVMDSDGSGSIDMEEFKTAMAIVFAVNKMEQLNDDSDADEVC